MKKSYKKNPAKLGLDFFIEKIKNLGTSSFVLFHKRQKLALYRVHNALKIV